MKQEDKELLLKDLCARLPYGTMVYAQNSIDWYDSEISTQVLSDLINEDYIVKPYLFPLSSMTEEQMSEYDNLRQDIMDKLKDWKCAELLDWLNKNHFDYRDLIEKGLAIDATDLK